MHYIKVYILLESGVWYSSNISTLPKKTERQIFHCVQVLLLSRSLSLKCLYCTLYLTRRVVNTLWWLRIQLIHEMVVFWGPSMYLSGSRHQWQELAESRIYKFSVDKYVQFTMTNYNWFMTWLCFEFLQCCHSWSTFGGPLLSKKPKARNQVIQKSHKDISTW